MLFTSGGCWKDASEAGLLQQGVMVIFMQLSLTGYELFYQKILRRSCTLISRSRLGVTCL